MENELKKLTLNQETLRKLASTEEDEARNLVTGTCHNISGCPRCPN
jgi:hypothetical protein